MDQSSILCMVSAIIHVYVSVSQGSGDLAPVETSRTAQAEEDHAWLKEQVFLAAQLLQKDNVWYCCEGRRHLLWDLAR